MDDFGRGLGCLLWWLIYVAVFFFITTGLLSILIIVGVL